MDKTKKDFAQKNTWIKPRHTVVRGLIGPFVKLYCKVVYGIRIEKFTQDKERPFLILSNHQTAFDQFFVSLSFSRHVYYVATEDIFSNGWVSRLITWLVAPIPFRKSTSDMAAVKNCVKVAKEGGNIGLFPEGNRTYSGTTEYIKPSVAALAKILKLPIAFYRIEGGYGIQPRWSDKVRRGKMRACISRVMEPEEYRNMSKEELFEVIQQELYVDERTNKSLFYSKRSAEFLDRAMYYCPFCGLSVFHAKRDIITCDQCKKSIRYLPDKTLEGIDFTFPYRYVKDWYDAQSAYTETADFSDYQDIPVYLDPVCFQENIYCRRKKLIDKRAVIEIYVNRIDVATGDGVLSFPFSEITALSVLGRNKLNLYHKDRIFQCKGNKHFNALKYVNIYYSTLDIVREDTNGKFLGL